MNFFENSKIDFDSLEEPENQFELQEVLGEGTYGEVYAAVDLNSDPMGANRFAVKILENLDENMEEAEVELHVLRDLSLHPNLPSFYGIFFKKAPRPENSQLWFIMELCSGGSVTDLVQCLKKFEGRKLSEMQIAFILKEVVDAISHLHLNHCMHRDVKGHNILLTSEGRVKLIDFGVCYQLAHTMDKRNTSIGTPFWMAPEVIACERQIDSCYDNRCDVWSIGITSIEIAEGEPPLADLHPMRALLQIPRNPPPTLTKPDQWSRDFNDFISECLVKDFEQRPLAVELLQHPFLLQVSTCPDIIRKQLVSEIELVKTYLNRMKREPEATVKHGKLKTDRKSGLHTMFIDDLASLPTLDEKTILDQLFHRYEENNVYTFIGDILIAINPFQELGIYTDFYQYKYRRASTSDLSPHIFGLADQVYHSMLHQKMGQNIVLCGSSAAGKTENAKFILQQLVYLGRAPNRNLEAKILQTNPIIEAFGNAATGINLNSSRFGKYLDATFNRSGLLTGAYLSVYLLEESRVNHQAQGEKNFHIFYYLLDGLQNSKLKQELKLDKKHYTYLTHYNDFGFEENLEHFKSVKEGLHTLGFREHEIDSIFKIVAAILHIGEIRFDTCDDGEGCCIRNQGSLEIAASLLGVSSGDLGLCFTASCVVACGETFMRRHSCMEAITTKDSLVRGLYSRLFKWICHSINVLLGISRIAYGDPLSIGILDIFGFETFEVNSLEQLYINIANEQLQYYFNHNIFTWEQQEYMAEGIDVEVIPYAENRPILDLCLGRPVGLFALIDEESRFHRSTELTLIEKLNNHLGDNQFYQKSKSNTDCIFAIRHSSGKVVYNAKDFLKKNRNLHSLDSIEALRSSANETVSCLYRCLLTKTGQFHVQLPDRRESIWQLKKEGDLDLFSQTKSKQTISSTFQHSLADLMTKLLMAGKSHFVRCIKPNDSYDPNHFDHNKVLKQLRHGGIFETVKIRQIGYSHRFTFSEFLKRYCFLAFGFDEKVVSNSDSCRILLLRLKMDNNGWALGTTKVFLKYYHVEYLSKLCEQQIKSIIFVQSCIRRWLAKLRIKRGMYQVAKTIVSAQKAAKFWKTNAKHGSNKKQESYLRKRAQGIEEVIIHEEKSEDTAAVFIQSRVRGFLARKKYGPLLEERIKQIMVANEKIEDAKKALENEGIEEEEAAMILQRFYRKWKKQQSQENESEESCEQDITSWDAPFLLVEENMVNERAGIKKKRRERVDMQSYRRELILAGLQSQDLANQERERIVERKWSTITSADGGIKMSKFGQQLLHQALERKVHAIRKDSAVSPKNTKPIFVPKKEKGQFSNNISIESSQDDQGPVDFRKFLRKTSHAPTNSLRRRENNDL